MDRIRQLLARPAAYEPIEHPVEVDNEDHESICSRRQNESPFSRYEYGVFFLLGVSMLWAWNMFLAAAPYFYLRFQSDNWAVTHFQPSILTVSTITNLGSSFILAKLQKGASYPRRVTLSLLINMVVFLLLAFSTVILTDVGVRSYFGFLMLMVFGASLATGVNQNGVFAYVSSYGREEYTQAIMAGQGVAGVLPCVVQIISALAVPAKQGQDLPQASSKSAFMYFITATFVAALSLVAFLSLVRRRSSVSLPSLDGQSDTIPSDYAHKTVSLWTLFKKLQFLSLALFLCFAATMVFPVFTVGIESVRQDPNGSRLFSREVFIPLAFLIWNVGDLIGRVSVIVPSLSLAHHPWAVFIMAVARLGFIPLYLLCNIGGRGAIVKSDFFYLFVVQLLFGVSNGYLGSSCMMGAGQWVSADEREAAGGFMSMVLVGGLAAGSLMSFLVASI
ncbi:nucleoside transmembrane transporter FUN26 [Aspergillus clavatus NRRL 1]|uniref:Nucleoside transporter family n=1 Tax=Aspergillus clavatus (strain ATCC 1007 / CBS 513.65 / DSM 816 / NCTC 3887 / NRRL 1 / QM 1276 / 107) TaxID=344612 RepID=A1CHU4_ASPCL|nr:Nucleoside transporter family [Aspergillus clavatus NRRL 1]EAW10449.1 Nucleoside transporter family [Aspergillus clavatus NRRL 1]